MVKPSTTTAVDTINCPYKPQAQQGWECPRCGRINAPWVSACSCSRNSWTITCNSSSMEEQKEEWWKVNPDIFRIHPESAPTYEVGGSDYWDPEAKSWTNVQINTTNNKE